MSFAEPESALIRSPILKRSGTMRTMTPASLNLERIYEQNRQRLQKREGSSTKLADSLIDASSKGKPRLLLMGQRRSFMDFQVWDFPGQIDYFDSPNFDMDAIFGEIGALIWVIDAQDDYMEAVSRLNQTIINLQRHYPNINIEVFIHKVDGLSDDYRLDIERDITIRIQDELSDQGFENAPVRFHLTSIYNHSIFEAFSKVIQKLVPRLGQLEAMLTSLCRTCRFEKAYLFDILSKIYIATDNAPADMASYEICSDYIDVVVDVIEVYGSWRRPVDYVAKLEADQGGQKLEDQVACNWNESCIVLADDEKPVMLREVDNCLALVAIMKEGTYDKMPLVNMNVDVVVKGLTEFFNITKPRK
ncbi:GTP-binding protein GTR2 [Pyricularia oryzae Y34]|uniref:GTP-binding protein n=2 Tax=Pyricularia oryzae TaxID=318829 RepID=A0AA97NWY7_PYRO3|nr:GTP-binding protein GTR2 [Pyricularia oryzae Y34]